MKKNKINPAIQSNSRYYVISLSLLIIFSIISIFIGILIRERHLMNNIILDNARAHFTDIVIMRKWNANYGGVFVEKKKGIESNPYLENPDIKTIDGKIFTMRNPAIMTREISDYAEKEGILKYHITSLKPLNPHNKPDAFENTALNSFDNGQKEYFEYIKDDNEKHIFRYMAPVFVEQSCIKCHAKQDYKTGDIRGGISVSTNITEFYHSLESHKYIIVLLSILIVIILLTLIYFLTLRLMDKLSTAYNKINKMAVTDELTQLKNRRYFFSRFTENIEASKRYNHPISIIMMDIDDFKKINDTYGHDAGDKALKAISGVLKENKRKTDILARFGGEEFIMLLPETKTDDAVILAEKLRLLALNEKIAISENNTISISISLGVAGFMAENIKDMSACDELIKHADEALYEAKRDGKNRVKLYTQI